MKNGTTNPFSVICDDGKPYILKGLNDDISGKTLFNELIAYRLASLLDLPIPKCKIVSLPEEQIESSFDMSILNFKPGCCFASEYVLGNPRINPKILEKIVNQDDIPSIVLFDQLIINEDRAENDGNFYYDRRNKKLLIIDHTHIFGGWQDWTTNQIILNITDPPTIISNLRGKNYKYFDQYISGNSPFDKIQKRIEAIKQEDISGLFQNIPLEWNINGEDIKCVHKLINHQIEHLHEILLLLKDVFKKWKGAC